MDFGVGIAMSAYSIAAKASCFGLNFMQFQVLIGGDSWDSLSLYAFSVFREKNGYKFCSFSSDQYCLNIDSVTESC